jgi:hypothetical protein
MPHIINRNNVVVVNKDSKSVTEPQSYPMNDLSSVYTHWDEELKKNIPTENKLVGGKNNYGKSK